MRNLFFCILILAKLSFAETSFLKHPLWQDYLSAIHLYHRTHPDVYKPLELLPLDLIDETKLNQEITLTANEWINFKKTKKGSLAERDKEIMISRKANERLLSLLQNIQKPGETTSLRAVIDILPEASRLALTPLDPIFLNGVLGEKIKKDLAEKGKHPTQFSRVKVNSSKGSLVFDFLDDKDLKYKINLTSKSPTDISVKSEFKRARSLAESTQNDSKLQTYNINGDFYEKKFSDSPFGKFPLKRERFLDEGGHSHFSGDGHKH
jgi:hypothetical protein